MTVPAKKSIERGETRFLVVCLNPTMQKTLVFNCLALNEVNRVVEQRLDASGKGVNVTRVLTQLGEDAVHLTHLGGDEGQLFERLCRDDALSLEVVRCESPPRTCTTLVDRSASTTTEIVEPTEPVQAGTENAVVERFRSLLPAVHTLIISGTTAPGYTVDLYAGMIAAARQAGVYVIADFRGAMLKRALRNDPGLRPNMIKPNLQEFVETFLPGAGVTGGVTVSEHTDDPEILEEVRRRMTELAREGLTTVITRGANPALAVDREDPETPVECEPLPLTPVNTIGCGDAFTAGLGAELARGGTLHDAIEQGHVAAAMNAALLKPGAIRP